MAETKTDKRSKPVAFPRYIEVAEILQGEIKTGVFLLEQLLPTEQVLCQRFSASRFTVREALKRLIDNGMVSRRQGSGTRVIATQPNENFVQQIVTIDELLQYSSDTRLSVTNDETVTTDIALATMLQSSSGESWHKVESLRLHNDEQKICWTDIYVRPEFKSVVNYIGKDSTPVFKLIEKHFDINSQEVNVQIQAGSMSKHHAQALSVEENTPMLIVIRRYRDGNGRIYEVSVSEHPAERFSYSINLTKQVKGN
jgi:GntR family transcriptional regulator